MPPVIDRPQRLDSDRPGPAGLVLAWVAATLLALVAGGGPARGAESSAEPGAELVAASDPCLNLRPGPSLDDAPVRCLPPGRRMTLLESRGDWGRVRLPDDQVGWVSLSLLKPVVEGVVPAEPAAPKVEPPRPEPVQAQQPEPVQAQQPEPPLPQPRPQPEPQTTAPPRPGTEREASMTALAEAEAASRRRVRELEAALEAAEAQSRELEQALATIIAEEDQAASQVEAAAELREEVDDLTALLRAAEMFLSESEKQRLDLARQVAALQEENRELRGTLGEEAAVETEADPESEATDSGVLLPEAPLDEVTRAGLEVVPPETPVVDDPSGARDVPVDPESDPADSKAAAEEAPPTEPAEEEAGAEVESAAPSVVLPEAPVAAPFSAPEPSPPEGSETSEIMKTVTGWARAWSEQRIDDYLSYYASSFQPPAGMSRAAWEAQRRQRISAPSRIAVKVALRDVRTVSPDRVEVEFLQSYESNSSSDQVVKTLVLVLESGAWKIERERTG